MNTYRHITQFERESILIMHTQRWNISRISINFERHKFTIGRELKRLPAE